MLIMGISLEPFFQQTSCSKKGCTPSGYGTFHPDNQARCPVPALSPLWNWIGKRLFHMLFPEPLLNLLLKLFPPFDQPFRVCQLRRVNRLVSKAPGAGLDYDR